MHQATKNINEVSKDLFNLEVSIVQHLKSIQTDAKENVNLNFICENVDMTGINGEWAVCGDLSRRAGLLKQSTFSIIIAPANTSVVSTTVFQARVFESLQAGAVPVILGSHAELPYSELLDWSRAVITLPKQRVTELYFLLRTYSNIDIMELKRNGRMFWETYFGTTRSVVSTLLAVLRTRLNIPARPVPEVPSVSAVSNFIPVPQHIGRSFMV